MQISISSNSITHQYIFLGDAFIIHFFSASLFPRLSLKSRSVDRRCNRCSASWWISDERLSTWYYPVATHLLVRQLSHSRFNLPEVYWHSSIIFPLKFSPDDKSPRGLAKSNVRRERLIGANKFTLSRWGGSTVLSLSRGRRIFNCARIKRGIFCRRAAIYGITK